MKNILIFLFVFIYQTSYSQLRDSIYVKTKIFELVYSEKLQQPKWIEYHVSCSDGTISRKGLDFYTCDSIITSDSKDYENNEWDKGHLAPAADFNCDKNYLYQTFTYLNCVLQHEKLNRGVWRLLEAHERELSKKYSVDVVIRMVYSKTSKKLPSGATIPDAFIKTIKYSNKIEIYYFKNEIPLSNDYNTYRIKK